MQLFVVLGATKHKIKVEPTDTIEQLYSAASEVTGLSCDSFGLTCLGKPVTMGRGGSVGALGLDDGSSVQVTQRLRGGAVVSRRLTVAPPGVSFTAAPVRLVHSHTNALCLCV